MRKRARIPDRDGVASPPRSGSVSADDASDSNSGATGPDADPYSAARAIALRQLTMTPRTRAELRNKMNQHHVPVDVAEAVLDRLEEVKLVDDRAFAESWVRSRQTTRGLARRALAHELRTKGVDDDIARIALAGLEPGAELATARRLVDRRLAPTRRLDGDARTRRLAGMLARKGYPSGLAMRVIREALGAEGEAVAGEAVESLDVP